MLWAVQLCVLRSNSEQIRQNSVQPWRFPVAEAMCCLWRGHSAALPTGGETPHRTDPRNEVPMIADARLDFVSKPVTDARFRRAHQSSSRNVVRCRLELRNDRLDQLANRLTRNLRKPKPNPDG